MQEFKLNKEYTVVCEFVSRRSGFKHVATLLRNGREIDTAKCLYENRTWEKFDFESVLKKIIAANFTEPERVKFLAALNKKYGY